MISAAPENEQSLSKEEKRLIEISLRIKSLRDTLPSIEEFRQLANSKKQALVDEIVNLEEEKEAIEQGQLILD